jgi:hypothetical protein
MAGSACAASWRACVEAASRDREMVRLRNPSLSVSEKRAILASWASDASAIASCPWAPAGLKAPVTIDEILEALCNSMAAPAMRLAASRTACVPHQVRWRLSRGEPPGTKADYHRHVVNRLERRWATRFAKMLARCRPERSPSERKIRSYRRSFGRR